MKISLFIASVLVILAIISAITGVITEQYELFTRISLVCSYTGLLAGFSAWFFLLRMWHKEDKKSEQEEERTTDTAETVEYDSCKLTF